MYEITNLGPARQFLDIEMYHEINGSISIGQKAFINPILKQFHMAYDAATPLDERVKLELVKKAAGEKEIDIASLSSPNLSSTFCSLLRTFRSISLAKCKMLPECWCSLPEAPGVWEVTPGASDSHSEKWTGFEPSWSSHRRSRRQLDHAPALPEAPESCSVWRARPRWAHERQKVR
jgi:hypothetical protein